MVPTATVPTTVLLDVSMSDTLSLAWSAMYARTATHGEGVGLGVTVAVGIAVAVGVAVGVGDGGG